MNKVDVFKLHRPIIAGKPHSKVFIYNKDQTKYGEFPVTKVLSKFMGKDNKVFVKGYLDDSDNLQILGKFQEKYRW